jgi:hypothetical protein
MDLVILLVLIGLVVFFHKKFSSVIYFIAIADILLRIITFIKDKITGGQIHDFINKYVPADIPTILSKYSTGLLHDILIWLYVVAFAIFEFYMIRQFFRKK